MHLAGNALSLSDFKHLGLFSLNECPLVVFSLKDTNFTTDVINAMYDFKHMDKISSFPTILKCWHM